VFEGHVTNTVQDHGQLYGREIQTMRPSVSKAMEDIDEEMQQILQEIDEDEQNMDNMSSMDNINGPQYINDNQRHGSRRSLSG
jgi:hypothetical protein